MREAISSARSEVLSTKSTCSGSGSDFVSGSGSGSGAGTVGDPVAYGVQAASGLAGQGGADIVLADGERPDAGAG
ncbi:MAG: hypothetical protein LBT40_01545 [Deltaproteobacteria bacterium]|nr:hypothetical protein [Deltaproteobacteria bacterium]